jgi:hypothetical protein
LPIFLVVMKATIRWGKVLSSNVLKTRNRPTFERPVSRTFWKSDRFFMVCFRGSRISGEDSCKLRFSVLLGVALECYFGTLAHKPLATLAATAAQDGATSLGGHACTETMLLLACAL